MVSSTVWAHHMFSIGMSSASNIFFAVSSMVVGIPTGIKIFNWLGTMYGGKIRFDTPMLFCIGFLFQFLIAGLTGIMLAVAPFDWQVTDSYFVVAHFHYVLLGGLMFTLFGALYYWFPKATGKMLDETLGKWHFWLLVIGFHLTFDTLHFAGMLGMPPANLHLRSRPRLGGTQSDRVDRRNLPGCGRCLPRVEHYSFFAERLAAGNDPWDAWTLEWATSSPPPEYNFAVQPEVRSSRPLWDLKHPEDPDWRYE